MENVNWNLISKAINFYTNRGFEYLETPWMVPRIISEITCPKPEYIFAVSDDQTLVGSAEQGFLDLATCAKIRNGKYYVSAGPCFRNEPVDQYHQHQFFKVELFMATANQDAASQAAKDFLNSAYSFMLLHSTVQPTIEDEGFGWDIMINGVEVGSYGYRYDHRLGFWAYGTGLAEPRFSQAIKCK